MRYRIYSIRHVVDETLYRKILDCCVQFCTKLVLVGRDHHSADSEMLSTTLAKLKPFLEKEENATEWPGTELFDETGIVRTYIFDKEMVNRLGTINSRLYDWIAPDYPEDLSLLRKDGTPFFVSISHEKDCYFKISLEALDSIVKMDTTLGSLLVAE